jgi:hypothetical protein
VTCPTTLDQVTNLLKQLILNKLMILIIMIKAKIDYSQNGPNDEYYTPTIAAEMILPFIPKHVTRIWECTAIKESKIVTVLRENGYSVIATHIEGGFDFLKFEPADYDLIISNPPFSIKDKFLQRAFSLKKPFMFLLPITSLEGVKRGKMYRENGIQLLIPDKRFSFTQKKHGAWFQTSWFTHGLGLEKDLNFIPLNNREHPSILRLEELKSIIDFYNEIHQAA